MHTISVSFPLCSLYFTVLFTKNKRENLTILPNKKNSAGKIPAEFSTCTKCYSWSSNSFFASSSMARWAAFNIRDRLRMCNNIHLIILNCFKQPLPNLLQRHPRGDILVESLSGREVLFTVIEGI